MDPKSTAEYFWGKKETLEQYFQYPSSLNGCLIQAQIAIDTKQISFDRFSLDGEIHKQLQGEGFTGISLRKGKWGIFPYRHLRAKSPKGREEYTLWVGLNTEGGKTLCFTLVYPYYLNEPSENQKKMWKDFVEKTTLLSLSELELASKKAAKANFTIDIELPEGNINLRIEKRQRDQKFLVLMEKGKERVEVKGLKDLSLSFSNFLKRPSYLVEVTLAFKEHSQKNRTVCVPFHLVDSFSYEVGMLNLDRLKEVDNALVFELESNTISEK
ncbi:MAG: hypothetical protein HYZ47_04055 [Simkania negevensis]|nr:hypothetical protein [Simkania negevensis]